MTEKHFRAAVAHAAKFYKAETQFELNLAGIGESTLHPHFPEFIRLARKAMPAMRLTFATNGVDLSMLHPMHPKNDSFLKSEKEKQMMRIVEALKDAQKTGEVIVFVSMHRPELGGLAHEVLCDALGEQFIGSSHDPSINADDWAGQVKWKRTYQQKMVCQWLRDGKVMVMADGRVTTCCLDASGVGVIGHVDQDPSEWVSKPFSLCSTCQQVVPKSHGGPG